jgi:HTH-type transcriptional regulator / antitoxin HigA
MATKIAVPTARDTCPKLVRQFRLVPIKDDNHLKLAHEMMDRLLQGDLDPSGADYLNVLADLIESYEDRHYPISDASDVDVLRELIRSNGLSQTALAKNVGIVQSTISDVLNGNRQLTKNQVIKLAELFDVDPSVILPNRSTGGEGRRSPGAGASESGDRIVASPQSRT